MILVNKSVIIKNNKGKDKMRKVVTYLIGGVIATPILLVILLFGLTIQLYNAYLTTYVWKWFMCPYGLPYINTASMYGIFILYQAISQNFVYKIESNVAVKHYIKEKKLDTLTNQTKNLLLSPIVYTLIFVAAWITHKYFLGN